MKKRPALRNVRLHGPNGKWVRLADSRPEPRSATITALRLSSIGRRPREARLTDHWHRERKEVKQEKEIDSPLDVILYASSGLFHGLI